MANTSPMMGRSKHRPLTCGYGCCVDDYSDHRDGRRRVVRRVRAIEVREVRAQIREEVVR